MTPKTHDSALSRALGAVLLVGAVLAGLSGLAVGLRFGVSALVGAAMAYANLQVLARSVSRLLSGGGGSWVALFLLKFAALFILTYVLIDRHLVAPLGLALGFGALPLGVVIAGLLPGGPGEDRPVDPNSPVAQVPQMEANPPEAAATRD